MRERRYLLHIEQMLEGSGREHFIREALERIDRERRSKALPIKNARAKTAGIGAGLLIQKALADYRSECPTVLDTEHQTESGADRRTGYLAESGADRRTGYLAESGADRRTGYQTESGADRRTGYQTESGADQRTESRTEPGSVQSGQQEWPEDSGAAKKPILECFSVEELLSVLDRRVEEPCYRYGKNGKPYLADCFFQFNLSHSGDYVFCGVSEQEIGVDIQKIQGDRWLRLAKRFFADPELRALEASGDEELRRRMFFRMWVRKEAYGKLTGEGIAGVVGKCLWRGLDVEEEASGGSPEKEPWWENDLIWEEYDVPDGYRMAVCRSRQGI